MELRRTFILTVLLTVVLVALGLLAADEPADAMKVHDGVRIDSDCDFKARGWPGSGNAADPYVIEGLAIDVGGKGSAIGTLP